MIADIQDKLNKITVKLRQSLETLQIHDIKTRPLFDAPYAIEYGFEERFQRHLLEIESTFGPASSCLSASNRRPPYSCTP